MRGSRMKDFYTLSKHEHRTFEEDRKVKGRKQEAKVWESLMKN